MYVHATETLLIYFCCQSKFPPVNPGQMQISAQVFLHCHQVHKHAGQRHFVFNDETLHLFITKCKRAGCVRIRGPKQSRYQLPATQRYSKARGPLQCPRVRLRHWPRTKPKFELLRAMEMQNIRRVSSELAIREQESEEKEKHQLGSLFKQQRFWLLVPSLPVFFHVLCVCVLVRLFVPWKERSMVMALMNIVLVWEIFIFVFFFK